jgi:hypothetical protein
VNPGEDLDTGDIIVHRPTKDVYMVACVHYPYLHTAGYPEMRLQVDSCVLKTKATESQRRANLEAMAQSASKGHRATCARERMTTMQADEYGYYDGD